MGERREAEGAAEFDEGEAFVGGGEGAAQAGFEVAALDADEVGGEQRFLFETGAAEGGALGGLFDGAGGDGEALGGVGVGEAGLFDFEPDAEGGFCGAFLSPA